MSNEILPPRTHMHPYLTPRTNVACYHDRAEGQTTLEVLAVASPHLLSALIVESSVSLCFSSLSPHLASPTEPLTDKGGVCAARPSYMYMYMYM